jgi:hypothetical protein
LSAAGFARRRFLLGKKIARALTGSAIRRIDIDHVLFW